MKALKKKISITIDEDILEEIKELADEDSRSLSQFITIILKKYLKEQKKENK